MGMLTVPPPEDFPLDQYQSSSYNIASGPRVIWSHEAEMTGWRIRCEVGRVYGYYDSPLRTDDLPLTSAMVQIARKSALAHLQQEALEIGATGIVEVEMTLKEIRVGSKLAVSVEASGRGVRII